MLLRYFSDKGLDVIAVDDRITSYDNIQHILTRDRPSHVVCTIGRTCSPVDSTSWSRGFDGNPVILPPSADGPPGIRNTIDDLQAPHAIFRNMFDNLLVPLWIAQACSKLAIHMSYFGTGCIYHYDEQHPDDTTPWGEEAPPNFAGSNYSAVKSITDQFFHQAMPEVLNIRIRLPVIAEAHPRNLLVKLTGYRHLYDIPNAYTYLPAFWGILLDCMAEKRSGTVNFVHSKPALLSDFYRLLIEEVGLTTMPDLRTLDLRTLGQGMAALRSQNAIQPNRLLDEWGIEVPDGLAMIRQALRELPEEEKEKYRCTEKKRI
jgi:3,5-epimerase/4-reductase